uniref:Uncharacterized protein n=1 Tax=viral metagenome TaxID=1070528 RepID=A0A6C0HHE9_9ZZZZ
MGDTLNVYFILYTAFRLAPFIVVSFFTLSSVLNQDLKGVIYLAGLLFATFFSIIIAPFTKYFPAINQTPENEAICNSLTLSKTGKFSEIPLGMVVFTYTFFYLVDIISNYDLVSQNVPTFIIFPVLIIAEAVWNLSKECTTFGHLFTAFAIGSLWGFLWARIIRSTGSVQLQYFNGINNGQVCSRPSKQKFKCTINR